MHLPKIGKRVRWQTLLWYSAIAIALVAMIRSDLGHLEWVSNLSLQGSPPPERDPDSPTGYVLEQRHFLGKHERGETYRWIAATQELFASGPLASRTYDSDTVPTGRPRLMPRLYTAWLATVAWGVHLVTDEPIPIAVERAALWEPVVSHVLAFAAAVGFIAIRYGLASAAAAALFFTLFPPISGQFLPGVLTSRTWALLFASYTVALSLLAFDEKRKHLAFSGRAAAAAALALWLDPAWGFPAVLVTAVAGVATTFAGGTHLPFLRWALIGSSLTLAAWFVDRTPWAPAAGELRYVHPLYAIAWLGVGIALDSIRQLRSAERSRKRGITGIAGAALLVSVLGYFQVSNDFKGWFYPSVWMRRITSLNETTVFGTFVDWLRQASAAEAALLSAPVLAAIAALVVLWRRTGTAGKPSEPSLAPAAVALAGLLALAFFRVRWGVVASLATLPLVAFVAVHASAIHRRAAAVATGTFLVALAVWAQNPSAAYKRPTAATELDPGDVETLLYRHFSHWLASHTPGQKVAALAPPELSDSIVFHGGGHVLMSTAWESYPGQLAARRILSAPESTEAEAVLQGRELTHVILPSWDKVLPLFVQAPAEKGRDTLFDRLQRWVYPAYLRPIPYRLPSTPVYAEQTLAVFKVTPPQDEPLSLARLAEYFVEMERSEPAAMVAEVLARVYPDDPNAAIGRAIVYSAANRRADFQRELARLVADTNAGRAPFGWDRRVQRAIVLALGRERELVRTEVAACLDTATEADLLELTPLQAYRLATLARLHGLGFPDPQLASLLAPLGAEYQPEK